MHPSPTTYVVDEGQASPAASAVANDDDWDLESAVGLDNEERVAAKRHLRDFQNSRRAWGHMA